MNTRQDEQDLPPHPVNEGQPPTGKAAFVREALGARSIVLVGMMGAGKSSIGRRLAAALDLPFFDADTEIEQAAALTVEEIFNNHGEAFFRAGEERVIKRLLAAGQMVLATGGGAVVSQVTRDAIAATSVSIWLNAPLELLMKRVGRRDNRPLIKTTDPEQVMARLLASRQMYYAQADIVFACRDAPHSVIIEEIISQLADYLAGKGARGETAC